MVHQHFKLPSTGGAIRSYYLARALVDHGHEVVVITAHNGIGLKTETVEDIRVHYLPVAYDNRFRFYKRSWSFVLFAVRACILSARYKRFEKCYAISVPLTVGWVGWWNKFRYGMPYIFEVGDLWPDAPVQMGYIRNPLLKWMLFTLEKFIYKRAESIVALSEPIKAAIQKKVDNKKIAVIPNMADCEFFVPESKDSELEHKYHVDGKFVVSYLGAIGDANGLENFINCATSSQNENLNVHFILCGEGALKEEMVTLSKKMAQQNVTILPFVNRNGVKEILNITDAVFICYKNVLILETGSPNKYFDGLAAGKLIILNFGGWIKNEVEEHSCGVYVDPRGFDFVKKIKPFLENGMLLQKSRQATRKLAEEKYSRKVLGDLLAKLF